MKIGQTGGSYLYERDILEPEGGDGISTDAGLVEALFQKFHQDTTRSEPSGSAACAFAGPLSGPSIFPALPAIDPLARLGCGDLTTRRRTH